MRFCNADFFGGFGGLGIFGSFGFIENGKRFVQDAPPGPGQGLERHLFRKLFVNLRQHLAPFLRRVFRLILLAAYILEDCEPLRLKVFLRLVGHCVRDDLPAHNYIRRRSCRRLLGRR